MKFGLLYELESPRPWDATHNEYHTYWEALAQIELADRIGVDHVWAVEHHFLEEHAHSSAPEVFFGAVSQRTRNIRISHGVRLLPFNFNHPIKLAEQAAVLDIISNGRVDFGTGRSTTTQELDGFNINYGRSRAEMREALEIIVKAWTEDILEYDGALMKVPPRPVVPKPLQKPHPPVWMACGAPESYQIAGDRGLGVLSFTLNWDYAQQCLESYHTAFAHRSDQVVKVANEQFAGLVICHVAENTEEEALALDGARWFMHSTAQLFIPFSTKQDLASYEYLRAFFGKNLDPQTASDAELKDHHMVAIGNPDEVLRKLEGFQKAGMDQILLFKQAGRIPHANIMRSIKRIGRYILPHFRTHPGTSLYRHPERSEGSLREILRPTASE